MPALAHFSGIFSKYMTRFFFKCSKMVFDLSGSALVCLNCTTLPVLSLQLKINQSWCTGSFLGSDTVTLLLIITREKSVINTQADTLGWDCGEGKCPFMRRVSDHFFTVSWIPQLPHSRQVSVRQSRGPLGPDGKGLHRVSILLCFFSSTLYLYIILTWHFNSVIPKDRIENSCRVSIFLLQCEEEAGGAAPQTGNPKRHHFGINRHHRLFYHLLHPRTSKKKIFILY